MSKFKGTRIAILVVLALVMSVIGAGAAGGPPGAGFYSGQTVQNLGPATDVMVTLYDMNNAANQPSRTWSVPEGGAFTFFLSDIPGTTAGFAWQCLVARRLAERGVRFVELIDVGSSNNWDAHGDMLTHAPLAVNVDQAIAGLLRETAGRDRFLVRGREYFRTMWEELRHEGLIRIFLGEYEGRLISGALMYVMGRQAWYTYGASSNESRNVMPNHLMQWTMIQAAIAAGCTVYDFRGVSCRQEEDADDHLQGLNRFKAGFGASFVEYIGEFDLPVRPLLYPLWTKAAPAALRLLKRRATAVEAE